MVRLAVAIFKFFASLGLALFLLLSLAAVFAVGTFLESAYGTEAAQLLVYRSPWMSVLLVGLALNVAASAFDRLPWKRKHVGFVVTHTGIILILAGSLITRAYGIEGQMAIREGETEGRMILDEPLLQLFSHPSGSLVSLSLPRQAFPWQGRKKLHENPDLRLLRYYPKASREEIVEPTANGPAAIQVELESSWMKVSHWLFLDDPKRNRIVLGPAELRFTQEKIALPTSSADEGILEFHWGGKVVQVSAEPEKIQAFPLEGTPYRVTLLRILKDAVVEGNRLVDQSSEWKNPACELLLEGKGVQEKHTVFAHFPDFPTLHGLKPSESGVRIFYRRPNAAGVGVKNELRFVWREDAPPLYQIRKGGEIQEGEIREGEAQETGWMDFRFRVPHYYPYARRSAAFSEAPVQSEIEEHLSAVELEVEDGEKKRLLWLGQGDKEEIQFGNRSFFLVYGLRMAPVGFRLRLRDFRVEYDAGTTRPASFESDVTLEDDSAGTNQDFTIRMNRPLRHHGFKIFQSGYQQPEGGPEVSVFTVAKDPGMGVKYAGAVVLIAGTLTMFYSKRFSRRAGEEIPENPLVGAGSPRP